jgi:hypothetical protein
MNDDAGGPWSLVALFSRWEGGRMARDAQGHAETNPKYALLPCRQLNPESSEQTDGLCGESNKPILWLSACAEI